MGSQTRIEVPAGQCTLFRLRCPAGTEKVDVVHGPYAVIMGCAAQNRHDLMIDLIEVVAGAFDVELAALAGSRVLARIQLGFRAIEQSRVIDLCDL